MMGMIKKRVGRGAGVVLVDAARHWARAPGAPGGFPADVTRSLHAAGLGEAIPALGSLLAIFLVHGHRALDLAPPTATVHRADELVLARMFDRVGGQGIVTEGDAGTLSRWLTPRGVSLGMRALNGLARAATQRTTRAALPLEPEPQVVPFPSVLAAE